MAQKAEADTPVIINMPRSLLVELYSNGQLEINNYEFFAPGLGIGTPRLGMEYELVFYGDGTILELQKYIGFNLKKEKE